MESTFDLELIARLIAEGGHRAVVGGEWDEIGKLQFSFLAERGLLPQHKLLDVGCGAMRGGVHFAAYLNAGCYFGIDISQNLLDKGREELVRAGLSDRVPLENISCSDNFLLRGIQSTFDFAIAHSLFTHLGFNRIRRCLEQICDVLSEDGKFFVTFFERPPDVAGACKPTTPSRDDHDVRRVRPLSLQCPGPCLRMPRPSIGVRIHRRMEPSTWPENRELQQTGINKSTSSQPTRRLTIDEASSTRARRTITIAALSGPQIGSTS